MEKGLECTLKFEVVCSLDNDLEFPVNGDLDCTLKCLREHKWDCKWKLLLQVTIAVAVGSGVYSGSRIFRYA